MTDFTETRSMLKKLAMAHGADTATGRACHNLLEMTEKRQDLRLRPAGAAQGEHQPRTGPTRRS